MDFSMIVSEDRIKKAYEEGEFENLPGFGKPLEPDDLSGVPEELRMAYRLLKNAGFSVEENRLRQEMATVEQLIKSCEEEPEKEELQQKLNEKLLAYNKIMSKRKAKTNSSLFKNYQSKIQKKLL